MPLFLELLCKHIQRVSGIIYSYRDHLNMYVRLAVSGLTRQSAARYNAAPSSSTKFFMSFPSPARQIFTSKKTNFTGLNFLTNAYFS